MSAKTALPMNKISSFLPYPNERVPENLLRKAENELRETPEIKKMALQELKNMLQEFPKTKQIHFEEDFLIHYLRVSKYTPAKSFKQLQNYADYRKKHNSLFQGIPDEYFSTKRSIEAVKILPERCLDGCIVFYIQVGKWNPDEISLDDMKKFYLSLYLQLFRDPVTQINGFKIIYDMKGTNILFLRYVTFRILYVAYHIPLNCCPSRIKGIHFVNQTIVLTAAWRLMSPFLPQKIRNRCHFHSDTSTLLEFFPSSLLPANVGGDLSDIDSTELAIRLNKEQQNQPIQGQPNFY